MAAGSGRKNVPSQTGFRQVFQIRIRAFPLLSGLSNPLSRAQCLDSSAQLTRSENSFAAGEGWNCEGRDQRAGRCSLDTAVTAQLPLETPRPAGVAERAHRPFHPTPHPLRGHTAQRTAAGRTPGEASNPHHTRGLQSAASRHLSLCIEPSSAPRPPQRHDTAPQRCAGGTAARSAPSGGHRGEQQKAESGPCLKKKRHA